MKVDPLVDKAARFLIAKHIASARQLQDRFGGDFYRARWLIRHLCHLGVVGQFRGYGIGRSVLMTIDDWEEFLQDENRKGGAPAPEQTNNRRD